jgi:hypothetical protein
VGLGLACAWRLAPGACQVLTRLHSHAHVSHIYPTHVLNALSYERRTVYIVKSGWKDSRLPKAVQWWNLLSGYVPQCAINVLSSTASLCRLQERERRARSVHLQLMIAI